RRVIRWALTVLLLAVLSLTIASVWWTFTWQRGRFDPNPQLKVTLERGGFEVFWRGEAGSPYNGTPAFIQLPRGFTVCNVNGYILEPGSRPPFEWTAFKLNMPDPPGHPWAIPWGTLYFPLAWAVLALAVPTGWLWWGQLRRRRLGGREGRGG